MYRRASGRIRIGILLVVTYWLALFIATHIPNPSVPVSLGVWDKAEHFLAYGLLAFLLCLVFQTGRSPSRRCYFWILAIVVAYGALDELLQLPVPGRTSDVWDWVADALGAICGVGLHLAAVRCIGRRKCARVIHEKATQSEPVFRS